MLDLLDLVVSVIQIVVLWIVTVFQILAEKAPVCLVITMPNQDKACSVMELPVHQTLIVYQEHVIILCVLTVIVLQAQFVMELLVA
jgi:hypothetical protein